MCRQNFPIDFIAVSSKDNNLAQVLCKVPSSEFCVRKVQYASIYAYSVSGAPSFFSFFGGQNHFHNLGALNR